MWHHRTVTRARCRSILFGAAALVVAEVGPVHGQTVYLFTSGSVSDLSNAYGLALETTYGTNNIVVITPTTTGATVNGTPVLFGGISNSVASFNLAGNLTLGSTDAIVTVGADPIQLNVAANATIATGAVISSNALAGTPGAGGGGGGSAGVRPDVGAATNPGSGGNGDAASTDTPANTAGGSGTNGTGATLVSANADALNSQAGSAGVAGVNSGAAAAAGGAGQYQTAPLATGGIGGQGGVAGTESSPNGGNGQNGTSGGTGANGVNGQSGGGGQTYGGFNKPSSLHGGGGGGGGSSGGDGMASGGGGQPGAGGGGYYNAQEGSGSGIEEEAPYGAAAGGGISGVHGNEGFNGGVGGAGGGGVGLTVGGVLTLGGQITANGENGTNATYNFYTAGNPVEPSASSKSGNVGINGAVGGSSGQADGNTAGAAGLGGGGGGGAGGSIFIVASSFDETNSSGLVANGGAGGNSGDDTDILGDPIPPTIPGIAGQNGDIRVNALGGTSASQDSSLAAAGNANPFRANSSAIANTPNFTSNIEGGVAAYGRLTNADSSFNTANAQSFAASNVGSIPSNAKAAVTLGTAPSDYSANYNTLNFISLGSSIQTPTYKLYYNVNPHINGYVPDPSDPPEIDPTPVGTQLLSSGWESNPQFVPGATGDQAISSLGANQTYQTMVERPSVSDSYNLLVAQYTPYQNVRTFTELYQVGTTPAPLYLTDTGLANYTIAFAGNGPAQSFTNIDAQTLGTGSLSDFAYRAGSGPKNFTIQAYNTGHSGSLMSGQLAVGSVSQSFSNLPSNNGSTFTTLLASYSSNLTAGHTDTAALNLASDAGNVSGNVNIDIVGPAFSGSSSTANFPNGAQGGFFVTLANNSTYTAIPTLSDLDILGVSIKNDPSGLFSVSQQNVTQPQLTAGASERIAVGFLGTTQPGNYFADLEVQTDQDADYQATGDVFDVQLQVDVAPEPSTAGLLAAAGAIFLGRRRRKLATRR